MTFRPPLGESDFGRLRERGLGYVDKTDFIRQVIDDPALVMLFPRPRRFGKTLFMSTLDYFLRKSENDALPLFEGLDVTKHPETMEHFQKYPVLSVSFKDTKAATFEGAFATIARRLQELCEEHIYLLDAPSVPIGKRRFFERVLAGNSTFSDAQGALLNLSQMLYKHHGSRVVILIDEYDTPIQSGYIHGYVDEIVLFFRNMFAEALKDNSALFKGVLTGILRVSKESMFSGLNHIKVHSILSRRYATAFGFTEEEVVNIIETRQLGEVRSWYNGYIFGGHVIYNPWSILNYIEDERLEPYWVNTGSTELIEKLALNQGLGLSEKSLTLLNGGTIEVPIEPDIVLRDVDKVPEAFWNFLLFSGYLKVVEAKLEDMGEYRGQLAIPNREVHSVYRKLFHHWMYHADPTSHHTKQFVNGLVTGDVPSMEESLRYILLTAMSYYDPAGTEPEKLYHGFVLGLLVHLEKQYEIRSNRETGFGRVDVAMRPKVPGKPGVILEFKVRKEGEAIETTLKNAAQQIRDRRYSADLEAAGIAPVLEYVLVFDGKQAWVQRVEDI